MKHILWVMCFVTTFCVIKAQGPPITTDKPIMLGGNSITVKTLMEVRTTNKGMVTHIPFVAHYLPTEKSLLGIHLPFVKFDFDNNSNGWDFADIQLLGKYQFYRKDKTGRTHRLVAKTIQTLPTGAAIDALQVSTNHYQSYFGLVSGLETLKYGISSEVGYNWSPASDLDEFRVKQGFGLPLLKPQYPNKQINLYFEYTSNWLVDRNWYQLLYAQGVQYARKNVTFDLAIQFPLLNEFPEERKLKQSVFIGARHTF